MMLRSEISKVFGSVVLLVLATAALLPAFADAPERPPAYTVLAGAAISGEVAIGAMSTLSGPESSRGGSFGH